MKGWILCLGFIFFITLLYADSDIVISKPYKVVDANGKYYFNEGDELMTVKVMGKSVILQKFNTKSLDILSVKEYEDLAYGFTFESVMKFAGKYYLFFSEWDKIRETEQLFYQEIDFANGAFNGDKKRILTSKRKIVGMIFSFSPFGFSMTTAGKFNFHVSNDDSRLLIQYRLKPEHKNDNISFDIIGTHVFDQSLTKVWGKEVEMPYTEKKMNNLDYSIDSQGNAYILAKVYNDATTKEEKEDKVNYHIEVLKINKTDGSVENKEVRLGDKFINRIWIVEGKNDGMICAGYYSIDKHAVDVKGVFSFKLDKDLNIFHEVKHEIPLEILNMYVKKKTQKKNTKKDKKGRSEFEYLELTQLIVESDGSILLVGEQSYVDEKYFYNASTGDTKHTITYYNNDILVTKLDEQGNLAWMNKLPKRQAGNSPVGGRSFRYFKDDNEDYHLLFLDNVKNIDLELNEIPDYHADGMGGFLTAYKVDHKTGIVSKKNYFDMKNVNKMKVYQFFPGRIEYIGNNEFVVELYKKKKEDVLIKVKL